MDKNKINKGRKITKTFQGGIYEEVMYLRKAIWALAVQQDKLLNKNYSTYTRKFTKTDDNEAKLIVDQMIELNNKIEGMRQ